MIMPRLAVLVGLLLFAAGATACASTAEAPVEPSPGPPSVTAPTLPPPTRLPSTPPPSTPVPATLTPLPPPTATPAPRISRAPGEVDLGDPSRAEIALTFDCGASGSQTLAILKTLHDAGVHSTFFITGQWATAYPELVKQIAAEHEIANHSWSHPDFATISDSRILDEMQRTDALLTKFTGLPTTKPLWRAPFGSRNKHILSLLQDAGYLYEIYWTADSADWTDATPEQVRANVATAARNGAIIIEHCGSDQTAAVLPQIIADLKARGFRLVTVSDLLRPP